MKQFKEGLYVVNVEKDSLSGGRHNMIIAVSVDNSPIPDRDITYAEANGGYSSGLFYPDPEKLLDEGHIERIYTGLVREIHDRKSGFPLVFDGIDPEMVRSIMRINDEPGNPRVSAVSNKVRSELEKRLKE